MNLKGQKGNSEKNLNYKERRSIDLVHQILNKNSNMYQENKNIADLFKFYGKILSHSSSKEFFSSMKKTWDIFNNPKNKINALKSLKKNRGDSFVILPLKAFNHMFATTVKRKGDDFSFTIVNKGYRMPNRSKYEEYIIPKSKVTNLLKTIEDGMGEFPVETFYKEFEKHSIQKYKLNIVSKNQKSGNCFTKEPETAIKFAYSTRNFSVSEFEKTRTNDADESFRPKWGISTAKMHKFFVREVKKDNPGAAKHLDEKLQTYLENKQYRKGLKEGMDNRHSLLNAFGPIKKQILNNNEDPCIELLANINSDTVRQHTPEIYKLVKSIGNAELSKAFSTLLDLSTSEDIDIYFDRRENFSELTRKINEINKFFPEFASEIKREFHLYYLIKSNGLFENKHDCKKALEFVQKANSLYPYNARAHFYEGYYTSVGAKIEEKSNNPNSHKSYEKATKYFSESIRLKPDLGDSYLLRGRMLEKLGHRLGAKKDFEQASKFGCVIVGHGSILSKNTCNKNNIHLNKPKEIKSMGI